MKKLVSFIAMAFVSLSIYATDLWEGSHAVAWDNTVTIAADKFAEVQMGQKIVVELTVQNEDVIELKSDGQKLPGTRFHRLFNDNTSFEVFLTKAAVDQLKAHGLEVCGSGFTLAKVWYGDGKDNVTEHTAWTGFFWMDEWSTLEIWNEGMPADISNYKAVRFYSEANRTNYTINILASWDGADKIADQTTLNMTNEYAELDLTTLSAEKKALFHKTDRVMIQCDKNGGEPFNFTAVEFIPQADAINAVAAQIENDAEYNILGQRVGANARGIIIKGGRKVLK